MGFIERFFNKKPEDLTKTDLEGFINRKIEESLNLEYKDIKAYNNVNDLSKVISAFANSDGGLLILGITEERVDDNVRLPKEITWGEPTLSKESLESRLISRIRPPIERLRIVSIRDEKNRVVFLIDVPQSDNPPHMAADRRYYKRWNFQVLPMEHFEVADLFGKRRRPRLTLLPQLEHVQKTEDNSYAFDLRFFVKNKGKASAKHVIFSASIFNADIIGSHKFDRLDEIRGCHSIQFYPSWSVIHPDISMNFGAVTLKLKDPTKEVLISYSLLAEDMPKIDGNLVITPEQLSTFELYIKKGIFVKPTLEVDEKQEVSF